MFVLLTTVLSLALGKILCQERENQPFTSSASPVAIGRGFSPWGFNQPRQDPTPRPLLYRTTERIQAELYYNRSNTDTRLQQPTRVIQENRRVFISSVIPERMHRHQPFVNSRVAKANTTNATSTQNDSDVYDRVIFIEDPPTEVNSVGYNGIMSQNVTGQPSPVLGASEEPASKPVTPENVAEVTLELVDRASFAADQCASGWVRIKETGECVRPEEPEQIKKAEKSLS